MFTHAHTPRLSETTSKLAKSQRTSKELGARLEEVQVARNTAESDLVIEKQWRGTLQVRCGSLWIT